MLLPLPEIKTGRRWSCHYLRKGAQINEKVNLVHWDLMMYFKLDLLIPCVSPNEHWHHTVFQTTSL